MTDLTRPPLDRTEIEEFWDSWLDINRTAEASGDWRPMAEWYAEDATYGWMYSPDEHFMAVGRDQIRDWAIGIEMDGFDGWHYDYVCTVIDEQKAMVVGFWKQRSGILDDNVRFERVGVSPRIRRCDTELERACRVRCPTDHPFVVHAQTVGQITLILADRRCR